MQKLRQHPILLVLFLILAIITFTNAVNIAQAFGTPADIALIFLVPVTITTGLLALFILSRIVYTKPSATSLKASQTTPARATGVITATISGCATAFFAYQIISMMTTSYTLAQQGTNPIPTLWYGFIAVPLALSSIILVLSVRSLKRS